MLSSLVSMMFGDSANVMYALLIIEWIGLDVVEVGDVVLERIEFLLHLHLKKIEFHLLLKRTESLLLRLLPQRIKTSCLHWSPT